MRKVLSKKGREVICGDLNASHTRWRKGEKRNRGGKVFMKLLQDIPMPESLFKLRAPVEPTRFGVGSSGMSVSSCMDIFLVFPERGVWASRSGVLAV